MLALAPPAQSFRSGRDFAAWMGLTPRQRSAGGKERLGSIAKAGERTLRRLLIIGASAVVRHASKHGAPEGSWLADGVFGDTHLCVPFFTVIATAMLALAPPAQSFRSGRDFAAWMGLTPRQRSAGGKERLGSIAKAGERTLRRLLIIGASAVVRHASKHGAPEGSWLAGMLARKPRMLITVALANKTARIIWAPLARGGVYKAPAAAA